MLGLTRELPGVFVMSDRSCLISLADRVELVLVSFIWVVCWLVCGLVGVFYMCLVCLIGRCWLWVLLLLM